MALSKELPGRPGVEKAPFCASIFTSVLSLIKRPWDESPQAIKSIILLFFQFTEASKGVGATYLDSICSLWSAPKPSAPSEFHGNLLCLNLVLSGAWVVKTHTCWLPEQRGITVMDEGTSSGPCPWQFIQVHGCC